MRRAWRPDWIDDEATTQEFYDEQAAMYMPALPPLDPGDEYLIGYLFEAGPTGATGMGGPLSWPEISAYAQWRPLTPWEALLLRRLSIEYTNESSKATENFYPPPWWPEDEPRPLTKEQVEAERFKRL